MTGILVIMINEEGFREYLKKARKKANVIDRNINTMKEWNEFITSHDLTLESINEELIEEFVDELIQQNKSPKGYLYVLMNYFKFTSDNDLLSFTTKLRETYTQKSRRIFKIKDFERVDTDDIEKLAALGIHDVNEMIGAATTKSKRKDLSEKTGITEDEILRLAQLSDITRVGYVKSVLAPLYHAAGITSPEILARYTADELHAHFKEFVESHNYPATVPAPKDLQHNISRAKKIKSLIEV